MQHSLIVVTLSQCHVSFIAASTILIPPLRPTHKVLPTRQTLLKLSGRAYSTRLYMRKCRTFTELLTGVTLGVTNQPCPDQQLPGGCWNIDRAGNTEEEEEEEEVHIFLFDSRIMKSLPLFMLTKFRLLNN